MIAAMIAGGLFGWRSGSDRSMWAIACSAWKNIGRRKSTFWFPTKGQAIATLFERLDRDLCAWRRARILSERQSLPPPTEGDRA
jgi:hypothetical protein